MPEMENRCFLTVVSHTNSARGRVVVVDNGPENRPLGVVWNEMIETCPYWKGDPDPVGVLLNTDCFVTEGWLEKLEKAIRHSSNIGFVGPMTNMCGSAQRVNSKYNPEDHPGEICYVGQISGFCLMFRREAWEAAGRFQEDAPFYGQESALIWNAQRFGWRVAMVLDCWVEHLRAASARAADARGEMNWSEERKKGGQWYAHYRNRVLRDGK